MPAIVSFFSIFRELSFKSFKDTKNFSNCNIRTDTDLVNYSYLADGSFTLGSLIYRKTGSNISLESAGFAGGRFVARETSPGVSAMVPMIHVTDQTNRFRYNSKEEQFRFGTPYIDYGARQYDPVLGRWFAQDPLSEKYYGISPYAFCNNNPINFVDPDGLDWYSYIEKDEDKSQNEYITKYAWTDATSQEELEASGVNGTYLGQAVVIFVGSEDEKLGEDGKLTGEGAKPAEVTIYGINGPDDIVSYKGLSVSSDPSKYSMIQEGEYKLFHQQMSESI